MSPKDRLRQTRENLKLSRAEFAIKLGLNSHQIRDMEIGKQSVTLEICRKVEEIFSVSARWLETGKDEDVRITAWSPETVAIAEIVEAMDKDTRSDILLSVQKEKLLRDLLKEKEGQFAA